MKPKRISPSWHRCFLIWVDDFDNMHDLLYICCPLIWPFAVWAWPTIAPLYHIQDTQWEQIAEPGFPVSIKLTACEKPEPCMNKICEDFLKIKGETQSKTGTEIKLNHLKLHKNISLHSGRVMIHLIPLNKRVASDTVVYYFRCLQCFKNKTNKKTVKNSIVSYMHYCYV